MNDDKTNIESNISFYNSIAPAYNRQLTERDSIARKSISAIFQQNIPAGSVMDFGGGTGLDLPWLLEHKYKVFFLEPSEGMRTEARKNSRHHEGLIFIDTNTDFEMWSDSNLPVEEKLSGLLANFAVLNCIENTGLFFEKISLLLDESGCLVITIIDPGFISVLKQYSFLTAIRLFMIGQLAIRNRNSGIYHNTFLHTVNSLRKNADQYFNLDSQTIVKNFVVLTFTRK